MIKEVSLHLALLESHLLFLNLLLLSVLLSVSFILSIGLILLLFSSWLIVFLLLSLLDSSISSISSGGSFKLLLLHSLSQGNREDTIVRCHLEERRDSK